MKYSANLSFEKGIIQIISNEGCIIEINFIHEKKKESLEKPDCLILAEKELKEYLQGKRKIFSFPIQLDGTDFQVKTWNELRKINFGQTKSYKEIAELIDQPKAARAIGNANNKNKLPIIIPCHRVIKNNGKIGGFAVGKDIKDWLLQHEKKILNKEK